MAVQEHTREHERVLPHTPQIAPRSAPGHPRRDAASSAGQTDAGRDARPATGSVVPAHPASQDRSHSLFPAWLAVPVPLLSLGLFAGAIYALWEGITLAGVVQDFILPTPLEVAQDTMGQLASGTLLANAATTLEEALLGFLVAALIAGTIGYAMARLRPLEILLAPFVAASQAVPAVAIAPIIILLLRTGLLSKVVVCTVIVVFPLLITTVTGLRGVGRDYYDVARVFGASRRQTLWLVELPLAAPVLLGGVKLGLTLSITGAVVGEFISAGSGLGFAINAATATFDTPGRYTALIALALISIALYGAVTLVERRLLQWLDV